jgi:hypothetical protein
MLTPVDPSIAVTTVRDGKALRLSWSARSWRANAFYRVYRGTLPDGDLFCTTSNDVTWVCNFYGEPVGTTRDHTFVVPDAPPGATYRIGVGTNWADDPEFGDIFAFSPSVRAAK